MRERGSGAASEENSSEKNSAGDLGDDSRRHLEEGGTLQLGAATETGDRLRWPTSAGAALELSRSVIKLAIVPSCIGWGSFQLVFVRSACFCCKIRVFFFARACPVCSHRFSSGSCQLPLSLLFGHELNISLDLQSCDFFLPVP